MFRFIIFLFSSFLLLGCQTDTADSLPVQVESTPFKTMACSNQFIARPLDHITRPKSEPIRMFDSNGAGLAINDLDHDGDLDIVLANLKGENTLLWNEGSLTFRRETLPYGGSRAVAIVDVEGDGWQDIIFTRSNTPPIRWQNQGFDENREIHFERLPLEGVSAPAYAMNWGDLDADGDLDLVTASYDAALMLEQTNNFLFGNGAGVFFYAQDNQAFQEQQLAEEAQALALSLADMNGDQQPDIAVGNDFDLPDAYWIRTPEGWEKTTPFATTSHSTMSFDQGDINNDGRVEWFATDMKPIDDDLQTLAAWLPLMEKGYKAENHATDPQWRENVLQVPKRRSGYYNDAYARRLDATGWSWSGKFGDLNKDGFLDIYVVNGMITDELFPHLPNGELIEANQVLRNDGNGQFRPMPDWQLNTTASGRGMSMADLDTDGDLDIVINNLNSPAILFENTICDGQALEIDLFWSESQNQRALGATLTLQTSTGDYTRDVRALSGYLSGDPARIHFGIPTGSQLQQLHIYWPDGEYSIIEEPAINHLLRIRR